MKHTRIGQEIRGDDPAALIETMEVIRDGDERSAHDADFQTW